LVPNVLVQAEQILSTTGLVLNNHPQVNQPKTGKLSQGDKDVTFRSFDGRRCVYTGCGVRVLPGLQGGAFFPPSSSNRWMHLRNLARPDPGEFLLVAAETRTRLRHFNFRVRRHVLHADVLLCRSLQLAGSIPFGIDVRRLVLGCRYRHLVEHAQRSA
jgi:hypothetical protein